MYFENTCSEASPTENNSPSDRGVSLEVQRTSVGKPISLSA